MTNIKAYTLTHLDLTTYQYIIPKMQERLITHSIRKNFHRFTAFIKNCIGEILRAQNRGSKEDILDIEKVKENYNKIILYKMYGKAGQG
jgi:hypothetical protein